MKETKFKQTEVGMIPSDWEVKTFCELFEVLPNNTLSRAELNKEYGSYKNVHYGDILVEFGEWIDCSNVGLPFINSNAKFNHTVLQDGDIVIADTAEDETVGKSTEITNAKNKKIVSGLHTIPIRPKIKFAPKWLGYYINSACWHDQILPFITGTKVSAISKAAVSQTKLFFPAKIEEQQRIANALSDVDSLIANLEKLIAKKKNIKQGAMQQLLTGKKRLPGFAPAKPIYKQTELGKIPTDWEVKTFGDVGKGFSAGATPYRQVDRYYEGDIKWVSSGELDYNVIQETQEHISIEAVKATNLTLHPTNTFLMAITGLEAAGTRGRCAILGCEATTNQSCLAIYESEYLSIPYLYHFYVKYGDALAFAYAQGSKQQSFTAAIVKKLPIILPSSKAEQTAIANVLSDMDTEISALETKLAKYRKLKTGMMQQLLTGKIRLV